MAFNSSTPIQVLNSPNNNQGITVSNAQGSVGVPAVQGVAKVSNLGNQLSQGNLQFAQPQTTPNHFYNIQVPNQAVSAAAPQFTPTWFNGQLYSDPTSLQQAQQSYYQGQYQNQLQALNQQNSVNQTGFQQQGSNLQNTINSLLSQYNPANGQGSITQNYNDYLASLGQNRDQSYQSQAGYNSYVAPSASQSGQAQNNSLIGAQYNRDLGQAQTANTQNIANVNSALQNANYNQQLLGQSQNLSNTEYQNSLNNLQQVLNGNVDAGRNSIEQLAQAQANYAANAKATGANVTTLNPYAIANDFAQFLNTAQTSGLPYDNSQLANQYISLLQAQTPGLQASQVSPIVNTVLQNSLNGTSTSGQ